MPLLTTAAVRKQIQQGKPLPVYLVVGDDDVEMTKLAGEMSQLVEEELRAFNVERIHGDRTLTFSSIVQSARTLPMMGDRRVVVVLRVEKMLKGRRKKDEPAPEADDGEESSGDVEALTEYVTRPEPLTTLVIVTTEINRATRLYKALQKHAGVVECWGLKATRDEKVDLRQLARTAEQLVGQAVTAAGKQIDPRAARLLAERAGTDIATLRGDVERLLGYVGGKSRIELKDAEAVVSSETSQDAWAMTNAIRQGDCKRALKELALALDAGGVPEMILGQLGWMVRNPDTRSPFDPRRIPAAVDALFRTDLDLKTSRGDRRVLLERLVVELCRR